VVSLLDESLVSQLEYQVVPFILHYGKLEIELLESKSSLRLADFGLSTDLK